MITGLASFAGGPPWRASSPQQTVCKPVLAPSCHSTAGPFGRRGSIACRFLTVFFFVRDGSSVSTPSPNLQSALGLAWVRGPAPARGSQQARGGDLLLCEEYARGTCAQRINTAQKRPRLRLSIQPAPFSTTTLSVADSTIPGQASPARPPTMCHHHMDLHGRYVPDPPLSPRPRQRLHRVHSVSPCQSSSLHSPIPSTTPRQASSGAGHIPGAGARRRSQRVGSYCNRRLALVPWPIADASYI